MPWFFPAANTAQEHTSYKPWLRSGHDQRTASFKHTPGTCPKDIDEVTSFFNNSFILFYTNDISIWFLRVKTYAYHWVRLLRFSTMLFLLPEANELILRQRILHNTTQQTCRVQPTTHQTTASINLGQHFLLFCYRIQAFAETGRLVKAINVMDFLFTIMPLSSKVHHIERMRWTWFCN